jgi:hypothetical protein
MATARTTQAVHAIIIFCHYGLNTQVNRPFNRGTASPDRHGNAAVTLPGLLLLAAVGGAAPVIDGTEFAQMMIQQRVVVRIPIAPVQTAPEAPVRWVEKKGPKCVGINSLAGFVVRGPQIVDLFVRGGARVRTRLEKQCTGVDLGYGFYVKPNADGRICSNRDTLHARSGGQCEVERFTSLIPER